MGKNCKLCALHKNIETGLETETLWCKVRNEAVDETFVCSSFSIYEEEEETP